MPDAPMVETQTLELPDVDLVHDVRGPLPTADGRPPLLLIGQPMCADDFEALAAEFPDRTVITYDPRGLGRSTTRRDGRTDQNPEDQAADLHALVGHLGAGPVDLFATTGGALTALAWAAAHPEDFVTVVAHEPPAMWALPDAEAIERAAAEVGTAYAEHGYGAGMAAFIRLTRWHGEYTDEYFAQPPVALSEYGLPAEDDGSRDDPRLAEFLDRETPSRPDLEALKGGTPRLVLAVGEETGHGITARTTQGVADHLGLSVTTFPGHHAGFASADSEWRGKSVEFGARLAEVLADDARV